MPAWGLTLQHNGERPSNQPACSGQSTKGCLQTSAEVFSRVALSRNLRPNLDAWTHARLLCLQSILGILQCRLLHVQFLCCRLSWWFWVTEGLEGEGDLLVIVCLWLRLVFVCWGGHFYLMGYSILSSVWPLCSLRILNYVSDRMLTQRGQRLWKKNLSLSFPNKVKPHC